MKSKKSPTIIEKIEITGVAAEGKAIARYGDLVIFVPFAAPGDVADIQLMRKKRSYAEGKVLRFHKYSAERAQPFCEHYGVCGGCKWQILPYAAQIRYKQQQIEDNLKRIGKIAIPEISAICGSKETEFYRNKLEFTFSNRSWLTEKEINAEENIVCRNALGFHIPGKFDKVLDIKKCWLQDDISNQIRNSVKEFAVANNFTFFDLRNQTGFLRNIIIRTATTGEVMLIVVFYEYDRAKCEALLSHISANFPSLTSLLYIVNSKANDTIFDQQINVYAGRDYIIEKMEDLKFKIGAKSFYQTNSRQAERLYGFVRDFAALSGRELVYDLYTGAGTIANFVARRARQVIGIEYVPEAIEDARINSRLNMIDNTLFFAGDTKNIMTDDFIATYGKPDVVITDPPRAGMHDDVINTILKAEPSRIVYVSCNPATQARDLALLDVKYKLVRVQPVDMFPHTHHVENVVLLESR
jgi:23S rRNA (uracil1939-C5)-methyltransferase